MMKTAEIWKEFHDKLYAFVFKRVKDDEKTRDILQDVFLKIHTHLPTLRSDEKLTSWVYQIARNKVTDHFRKINLSQALDEVTVQDEGEMPSLYDSVDCCLRRFLNELPGTQKSAIEKTYFEGRPQKEVAAELGLSYTGFKSRVQRGRAQLEEWIKDCCLAYLSGEKIEEVKDNCGC